MTTAREIAEDCAVAILVDEQFTDATQRRVLLMRAVKIIESALLAERRRAIEAMEAARKALRTASTYSHTCDLGGSCALCDQSNAALELIHKALSPSSPRGDTDG